MGTGFGVVLGVGGVEVLGGCWVVGGGSGRGFWIGKWIIDLGALPALWRGFGRSGRGGVIADLWAGAAKILGMLSASSSTS